MAAWMLAKYSNGNQSVSKDSTDFVQEVMPLVIAALQTPSVELRGLAVRCLGLVPTHSSNEKSSTKVMRMNAFVLQVLLFHPLKK